MLKKTLILIAVFAMAVPAMADPGWFIQGGEYKIDCTIPVKMIIPGYFVIVDQPDELLLEQEEGTPNWIGEETWYFVHNVQVTLTATLDPTGAVGADDYLVAIKGKTTYQPLTASAGYPAMLTPFPPDEATIMVKLTNVAYWGPVGTEETVAMLTVTISE